jgi:hypothetical protein
VHERSRFGHRATLLHDLAANGVETYHQRVPLNAARLAALLIERDADAHAVADMHGAPRKTRGMHLNSSHPAAAGVTPALLAVLDGVVAAA